MIKIKTEPRQINWSTQIIVTDDRALEGEIVASACPEWAKTICQCVNSHDELVKACKIGLQAISDIVNASDNGQPYNDKELKESLSPEYDKIVQVLENVEKA